MISSQKLLTTSFRKSKYLRYTEFLDYLDKMGVLHEISNNPNNFIDVDLMLYAEENVSTSDKENTNETSNDLHRKEKS